MTAAQARPLRPVPDAGTTTGPRLWTTGLCAGDCPGPRRRTAVMSCMDAASGRVVQLCARCLWRRIAAQINGRRPMHEVWDVTVCEDHPPEPMPTLPYGGRRLCSDCLSQADGATVTPLGLPLNRW